MIDETIFEAMIFVEANCGRVFVVPAADDAQGRRKLRHLDGEPGRYRGQDGFWIGVAELRKFLNYHAPKPQKPRTRAQKRADRLNLAKAQAWQQANRRGQ